MVGDGRPVLTARVAVYAHDKGDLDNLDAAGLAGSQVGCVVAVTGPTEMAMHLPAAFLDEMLTRDRSHNAEARLHRLDFRFVAALADMAEDDDPGAMLGPINLFGYIDNAEPFAVVETQLFATLRTKSKCRPRLAALRCIDAAFWGYWNWLLVTETDMLEDAITPLVGNLMHQFRWYDAHGFSHRQAGEAVRHGAFMGASDRARAGGDETAPDAPE